MKVIFNQIKIIDLALLLKLINCFDNISSLLEDVYIFKFE